MTVKLACARILVAIVVGLLAIQPGVQTDELPNQEQRIYPEKFLSAGDIVRHWKGCCRGVGGNLATGNALYRYQGTASEGWYGWCTDQ
ncbi:hypothetical protein IE81DRAFT_350539 [Ceraceosorus guamensis]|uniref:Uncharacterized protein n=1 Tax=Ceraceosorus guamensis TaxID=1522189 RepID=A0A316VU47_9BASI|nr:hypothetical protein IE81DRAFT_350539 [Ceraceosorus guamensis]PWN39035.1 hypothetical protein IE81DRAFT_350539 [Ceraceosorus guamensis]